MQEVNGNLAFANRVRIELPAQAFLYDPAESSFDTGKTNAPVLRRGLASATLQRLQIAHIRLERRFVDSAARQLSPPPWHPHGNPCAPDLNQLCPSFRRWRYTTLRARTAELSPLGRTRSRFVSSPRPRPKTSLISALPALGSDTGCHRRFQSCVPAHGREDSRQYRTTGQHAILPVPGAHAAVMGYDRRLVARWHAGVGRAQSA